MKKVHVALCAGVLLGPVAAHAAEPMLWPDEGHFYAYPAEPRTEPIEYSVSAGIARDDNLFRLSDGEDPNVILGTGGRSDTVRRVGVGLKADLPVSRQRFLLHAGVDRHDYNRFGFLDHNAYRLGGNWLWQAGNLWSGDAGYARRRYLADLSELQGRVKDLVTQDYLHASANYRFHPSWRVRGGIEGYNFQHSDGSRQALEYRSVSGTLGGDYITAAENHLGLQVKLTQAQYPNRELVAGSTVDNEYREYETSGVIGWQFAGKTRFDARLGYTNRRHDEVRERDFSGLTWRAGLTHTPSAKTLLDLAAYREIRSVEDLSASYILAEGVSFGPSWAPTVKSVLQARYNYEKREFRGDPGFVLAGGPRREDKVRSGRLAAGYKPLRSTELTLAYERGKRTSNLADAEYDFDLISLDAALRF